MIKNIVLFIYFLNNYILINFLKNKYLEKKNPNLVGPIQVCQISPHQSQMFWIYSVPF